MNKKLKKLYEEDQKDRENWKEWGKSIAKGTVRERDEKRRREVEKMLTEGKMTTKEDFYHAAMIFQHGNSAEHYKMANELAQKSTELGENRAKWLFAATLDRYLLKTGEKYQKYGTQYGKDGDAALWKLRPVDPSTTDEERAKFNIPPLKKLLEREKEFNAH